MTTRINSFPWKLKCLDSPGSCEDGSASRILTMEMAPFAASADDLGSRWHMSSSTPLPTKLVSLAGNEGIQKQLYRRSISAGFRSMRNSHPCTDLWEKQQCLGILQFPVAEVIDGSWLILGLVHEEGCLDCQAAHTVRGAVMNSTVGERTGGIDYRAERELRPRRAGRRGCAALHLD